jgi:hypothetical protein
LDARAEDRVETRDVAVIEQIERLRNDIRWPEPREIILMFWEVDSEL